MAVNLKGDLCKVTGITSGNTVAASSLMSDDTYASAEIMTPGYWFYKPKVGDTGIVLRFGNRDFFLGIIPSPGSLALINPGDLRIIHDHYMRSEDHQDFGTPPLSTADLIF